MKTKILDVTISTEAKDLKDVQEERRIWREALEGFSQPQSCNDRAHDIEIESYKELFHYAKCGFNFSDRDFSVRVLFDELLETAAIALCYILYGDTYGDISGTYNASATIYDYEQKHMVIVREFIN